jgi:DNA invertase Pin-like site-specific DNA recombinase
VVGEGPEDRRVDGGQVLEVLAAVERCQRELIAEGTRVGLAAARARGRRGGRRAALTGERLARAQALYAARTVPVGEIAREFGVGRSTLYRHLKRGESGGPGDEDDSAAGTGSR